MMLTLTNIVSVQSNQVVFCDVNTIKVYLCDVKTIKEFFCDVNAIKNVYMTYIHNQSSVSMLYTT